MSPVAWGIFPLARVRYCFFTSSLASKRAASSTMALRVLATRMTPEVSRSSRWAGEGLNSVAGRALAPGTCWRTRSTSVAPVMPVPGWAASPAGLLTAKRCSSSKSTSSRGPVRRPPGPGPTGERVSSFSSSPQIFTRSPSASTCSGLPRASLTFTLRVRNIL